MKHTVTEYQLTNGTRGLFIDIPGTDVFNVVIRFNSGFQFADPEVYELPHVMEHLMATSTEKYPGQIEFFIGATKNGAFVNAYTSFDTNEYVYECADFELDRILDLIEEQLVRPRFSAESLAAELGNVREELSRNLAEHSSLCSILLGERAFPQEVLNFSTRIDQLPDITLEKIEAYYIKAFTASNARFYLAGDISNKGQRLKERFGKIFDQLPKGNELVLSQAIGRNVIEPIVIPREIAQIYYRVSWFLDELSEPETKAMVALRLALTGGMGSRILGEVRRGGLAYGVTGKSAVDNGNSSFGFEGYVTSENAIAVFKIIAKHIGEVLTGKLTNTEIDASKRLGIGSTKRSSQTVGDALDWYLGRYERDRSINDFDRYLSELDDVTAERVTEVTKRIFTYGHHGISFVGDITDAKAKKLIKILEPIWK